MNDQVLDIKIVLYDIKNQTSSTYRNNTYEYEKPRSRTYKYRCANNLTSVRPWWGAVMIKDIDRIEVRCVEEKQHDE